MSKKSVVVLFGGCSPEYGVSLDSASSVIRHIDREKYTPVSVGITQRGDWYYYDGDVQGIAEDTWHSSGQVSPAILSPDRSRHRLLIMRDANTHEIPVDVVFPVMHGRNGEDGTIQGLCELAGLPLVGCGTLASALAMDKDRAHTLAQAAGISIPRSFVIEKGFAKQDLLSRADVLGYPLFVKPVRAGSSYGITMAESRGGLLQAIDTAFAYDTQVIIEEMIPGFEVGCAVIGNHDLITGEIDEIELSQGFFDFTEKYHLIASKIHVPARIPPGKAEEIKHAAKIIYRALGCRGFARVDMFLTPSGGIVFNEVNTIPGFTAHSWFPGMLRAAGMSFEQVISRAIALAAEP